MGRVEFHCSLAGVATAFPHFWEHIVGSDHASIALRANWQAQLRRCRDEQRPVAGTHKTVDAWVVRGESAVIVLLTNHALPRHSIRAEQVQVCLTEAPQPRAVVAERIDEEHANAKRLWRELGEPMYLNAGEVAWLHAASQTVKEPQPWTHEGRTIRLDVALPPHAVAAVTVEFTPGQPGGGGPR